MRSSFVALLGCFGGIGTLLAACANGDLSGSVSADAAADSTASVLSPAEPDAGAHARDSSSHPLDDAGGGAIVDGGTEEEDSGPTMPRGDCTGSQSAQFPRSYDALCHNYFLNTSGANPCTPGMNECAPMDENPDGVTFCCFTAPSGSLCEGDYAGQAQCVPR